MHGLLYFLWINHSFQKFQNAIFWEVFQIPAMSKCNRSRTTPKKLWWKMFLDASPPQSLDTKRCAADAEAVLWPHFFTILLQTYAKQIVKVSKRYLIRFINIVSPFLCPLRLQSITSESAAPFFASKLYKMESTLFSFKVDILRKFKMLEFAALGGYSISKEITLLNLFCFFRPKYP